MEKKKIGIIGAGNMGSAIIDGLLKAGFTDAAGIYASDKQEAVLDRLKNKGLNTSLDNIEIAKQADIILVAVKPYLIEDVLEEIKPELNSSKALVSIVAGVSIFSLELFAGNEIPIFRVIPNTAISLQESLTCISSNKNAEQYREVVSELFGTLGKVVEIPESLMAAATVQASCGIAYALRYIRASMQAGIEMGFGAEMSQYITAQTLKGAAELILQTGNHPELEIDKVTTPGGITITGLNEMEDSGFSASVIQGMMAAFEKLNDN